MADLMYDLEAIRSKMRKKKGGGRSRDPNEWRPDKAETGKPLKWKFFILPPVDSMDIWYYEHGNHFIDNKVIECPRIHDGATCPLCQLGFDLMKETDDKEERRAIAKKFLSSSRYSVNIYFPSVKSTSADLRGKVKWFSMPQSIYGICEDVIMRDPPEGDAIEPEPFGIFFDPENAMPFVLEARKKGEYNSYEASHFIDKKMPITNGGEEKIKAILDARHDIPTLFPDRDVDLLETIASKFEDGSRAQVAVNEGKEKDEEKDDKKSGKKEETQEDEVSDLTDEILEDDIEDSADSKKPSEPEPEAEVGEEDEDLKSLLDELNSD